MPLHGCGAFGLFTIELLNAYAAAVQIAFVSREGPTALASHVGIERAVPDSQATTLSLHRHCSKICGVVKDAGSLKGEVGSNGLELGSEPRSDLSVRHLTGLFGQSGIQHVND
eukprot:88914-Rhodomonas_salina.1